MKVNTPRLSKVLKNRNIATMMKQKREDMKDQRTNRWSRKHDREKWVSSKDVHNMWVQDRSSKMVIIGSDCVSLYPNLTKQVTADEVAQAVIESEIKWKDINWKEAVRYLVLGRPKEWRVRSGMSRILPHRRFSRGTKPGMTGAGPIGPSTGDELQWVFPSVELTSLDKKKIFSEVMRLAVENMFSTHCYTFARKFYRQT